MLRLALYQPDIPQNTGAMIRIAACFDAVLEIIEPCGFPMSEKVLRRAAMDYGEIIETRLHSGWSAFSESIGEGRLILLTTKGVAPLWEFEFRAGDIILMGRESIGAPQEVHEAAEARIRIPIAPRARSMNVATAAAVAVAEARRQLGGFS